MRRTVVVTFDYSSLALLELLRRQTGRTASRDTATPAITAALMINGSLFADAYTHPWQGTPLLRSPLGALAMRGWQRSPRAFGTGWKQARMYSRRYHPTPAELTAIARDLDGTVAFYVGGSDEDPYEHWQIPATREHPGLLAAIRGIAERHGAGTAAAASR